MESKKNIKKSTISIRKLAMAGVLVAVAVAGSLISFPVAGSKCAPIQHMVNICAAVFLGPVWGVGVAFCASVIRNLTGLGSLIDRKSTRLNSSHWNKSRMPSSA